MDWIRDRLDSLKLQSLWRETNAPLEIACSLDKEPRTINLCSNDYLGLSTNPRIIEAAVAATQKFGSGCCSSRLVSGTNQLHEELERSLSDFAGSESALVYGSGYLANIGLIGAVVRRSDVVFSDRLIHASLVDGITLSRAKSIRYQHNNLDNLDALLAKHSKNRKHGQQFFIVTEDVFSMDGDLAPLRGCKELARKYDAQLIVDKAHALGVFSRKETEASSIDRFGKTLGNTISSEVGISTATLSKSLASYGGVVFCDKLLRDYLVNTSRSFIFNTAILPAALGAALGALEYIREQNKLGLELLDKASKFRAKLNSAGLDTLNSESHIVPILIGENERTLEMAKQLRAKGIYLVAIRPPTVPFGQARLRVSINLNHSEQQLEFAARQIINTVCEKS